MVTAYYRLDRNAFFNQYCSLKVVWRNRGQLCASSSRWSNMVQSVRPVSCHLTFISGTANVFHYNIVLKYAPVPAVKCLNWLRRMQDTSSTSSQPNAATYGIVMLKLLFEGDADKASLYSMRVHSLETNNVYFFAFR